MFDGGSCQCRGVLYWNREMQSRATQSGSSVRKLCICLVATGFAGLQGMAVEMGDLHRAWAQQPTSAEEGGSNPGAQPSDDRPGVMEPPPGTEPTAGSPPEDPRFLPRMLRPKLLTPEELEEAERLKKLAAKYGTDPTAIVGRVQLSSQYADLHQGGKLIDSTARVDLPFRGNWLIRVDAPFIRSLDPNSQNAGTHRGLSDLAATVGWRVYNTPEYAFILGATSTFPTATDNGLGSGKYATGPFFATARFLPRWDSFLFGIFQHLVSVGGDPSRRDIELTRATVQINSILAERWWTIAQGVLQVDWERSTKSSMTFEFEVGRSVVGLWGIYARPGVGLWGQDLPGAYDWNVEFGIRRMFRSF